jgi:hypothetical protein
MARHVDLHQLNQPTRKIKVERLEGNAAPLEQHTRPRSMRPTDASTMGSPQRRLVVALWGRQQRSERSKSHGHSTTTARLVASLASAARPSISVGRQHCVCE